MRTFLPKEANETGTGIQQHVASTDDAKPSEFEVHVRKVQTQLIDSVRRAGMTYDPYSRIVEAQAAAIGVLPEFVQAVKDNHSPFSDQERREFERTLATGTAAEMNRMTWWLIARSITLAAGALMATLAIGSGVGYWLGYSVGTDQAIQVQTGLDRVLKGRDAAQWLNLMRMNKDGSLRNCTPVAQPGDGAACTFTLWTKLPSAKGGT
jgi:hypothetical protein